MPETRGAALLAHPDATLAARLAASGTAVGGEVMTDAGFFDWFESRRRAQRQVVRKIPFADLKGWSFAEDTGDLRHQSGRFYSVRGLSVRSDFGPVREWMQPIISQPEVGVLGIAVREINGLLHCLMQAKAEPGNPNGVQLSPTVQATKSNYSRVHGGSAVPYLECFRGPRAGRVLADVLQSEQGTWFHCKRNRNVVVEVGDDVEAREDFCWLTLRQLGALMRHDNLLNMDSRTVMSCIPYWHAGVDDTDAGSLHLDVEIRSWITAQQIEHDIEATLVPLHDIDGRGWHIGTERIHHERELFFDIIAVDVQSTHREVTAWSQPLLAPRGKGIAALLVRRIGGVLHSLIHARVEPGYLDVVELGPTVQCTPENYAHLGSEDRPPYLDVVLGRGDAGTVYDTVLSEEGGRFYHAETRYLIIEVGDDFPVAAPDEFRWMSLRQLTELLKYSHYLNVQARTLVAALRTIVDAEEPDARHR